MKIGVVIQGSLTNFYALYKNIYYLTRLIDPEDIVVSSWDDQSLQDDINVHCIYSNIKALQNSCEHFRFLNKENKYYQIYSTYHGIQYLLANKDYDYIIKVRTDEFFSDYDYLLQQLTDDTQDKIHCSSIFFRNNFPFHIGDHILAGSQQKMCLLFQTLYDKWQLLQEPIHFINDFKHDKYQKAIFPTSSILNEVFKWNLTTLPPETLFALHYLWGLGHETLLCDHVNLMQKYFDVISVVNLGSFCINSNTLKLSITHNTINDLHKQILTSPKLVCADCQPEVLCNTRQHQALLSILIHGITTNINQLVPLNSDVNNYNSLRAPWRILDNFKNMVEI